MVTGKDRNVDKDIDQTPGMDTDTVDEFREIILTDLSVTTNFHIIYEKSKYCKNVDFA
jgi:hypothetical protein